MLIIVSYDIVSDRTRTKLAHKLKDYGPRVQKSVFEADVSTEELKKLNALLKGTELGEEDSIRLYRICSDCYKKVKVWGNGEVTKDKEFYIQ